VPGTQQNYTADAPKARAADTWRSPNLTLNELYDDADDILNYHRREGGMPKLKYF
jgi:hypothetical protein